MNEKEVQTDDGEINESHLVNLINLVCSNQRWLNKRKKGKKKVVFFVVVVGFSMSFIM